MGSKKSEKKLIKIPKFVNNENEIEFEEEGHHSLFQDKGRNGDLKVKVNIIKNPLIRREGNNIVQKHFITLTQAI